MSFSDILKKSFLEGFTAEITIEDMIKVIVITSLIALYIFMVYRITTRKSFYSKSFNISLVAIAVITASIIITIQTSAVISLGMVGALSIVRFRTAIKEPMDLVFLFWSIGVGIICGAGQFYIAFGVSIVLTILIVTLESLPVFQTTKILVVNAASKVTEEMLSESIKKFSKYHKVKSRSINLENMEVIMEIKLKKDYELIKAVSEIEGVKYVSLLSHDGEVTY